MKNNKISFITYTALFLALLIVFQYVSKPMGQFVTGSMVNLVLIASTLLIGVYSGITVALISPFLAYMLGIGTTFIQIIPVIAIGNLVLVLVYGFIMKKYPDKNIIKWSLAIAAGAVLKFIVLYFGIVKIALPFIPNLKEKQIAVLSSTFSWPQLITALIGGILAFGVVPLVKKAVEK